MNAYPRLSELAYKNAEQHRREVIDVAVSFVADIWRYYKNPLDESQILHLKSVLEICMPQEDRDLTK